VLVALALLVVLRVVAFALLPGILDGIAEGHDLSCTYERLDVSLLTGDVELWHLVVAPRDGGPAFADVEYCRADLSILHLLIGRLVARRVEADGADLLVERAADGQLLLAGHFASDESETPDGAALETAESAEEPSAASGEAEDGGMRLAPPLRLDALRVQHLRLVWRDASADPPVEMRVDTSVWLSDLASSSRPLRFGLLVTAEPVIDALELTGTGRFVDGEISVEVHARGAGIALESVAHYLRPLGIAPDAGKLDLDARLTAALKTTEDAPGRLSGVAGLSGLSLRADDVEVVALDEASVELSALDSRTVDLGRVTLSGLRAGATRAADGSLRVGGLGLVPRAAAPVPEDTEPKPSGPAPALRIASIDVADVALAWRDEDISPVVEQTLVLDSLHVEDVELPSRDDTQPARLEALLRAPGVMDALEIRGEAVADATGGETRLEASLSGLAPEGIEPYLHAAGLTSTLRDGRLALELGARWQTAVDGGFTATTHLAQLHYSDAGDELLDLGTLAIQDLVRTRAPERFEIASVECSGMRLPVRRDTEGRWHLLGLVLDVPPASTGSTASAEPLPKAEPLQEAEPTPTAAPDATAEADEPTPWSVRRVSFSDERISVTDELHDGPAGPLTLELGAELLEIRSDERRVAAWPTVEGVRLLATSPGLIGRLLLAGSTRATDDGSRADLALEITDLATTRLAPFLEEAGLDPTLEQGTLRVGLHATSRGSGDTRALDASLESLELLDAERSLLSASALRLEGLSSTPGRTLIRRISVEGVEASAKRDGSGALHVAGLRVPPPAEASAEPESVAEAVDAQAPPTTTDAGPVTVVEQVDLDVTLHWKDQATREPVALSARVDASVGDLTLGEEEPGPATLRVGLETDGTRLDVDGQVRLGQAGLGAEFALTGSALRAGTLASYLPPGIESTLQDGRLQLQLAARLEQASEGGQAASLTLGNLVLFDGDAPAQLELDRLHVSASRLDALAGTYVVDEVLLSGLRLDVTQESDGSLLVPALRVSGIPAEPATAPRSTADAQPEPGPSDAPPIPASAEPSTEPSPEGPTGVAPTVAPVARTRVPDLLLGTLDLGIDRLALHHGNAPGAPPLVVSDLRLHNLEPIVCVAEDPESSPPVMLRLAGGLPPVVDALALDLTADPLASNPRLSLALDVRGVRGPGLMAVRPDLAETLDAWGLSDGRLGLTLEVTRTDSRRDPLAWDPAAGLIADVALEDLVLRDGDGPVLVGLEALSVESAEWRPRSRSARVRLLEIVHPVARIERRAEGLAVAGIVLKTPPEEDQAPDDGTKVEEADDDGVHDDAPPPFALAVGTLLADGLDVEFRDTTVTPPMGILLNGLSADVVGFDSRTGDAAPPLRLDVLLNAGPLDMPGTGADDPPVSARVPAFQEIALSGRLQRRPELDGFMRAEIEALDLATLSGTASASGVELQGGTLDARVDLRFPGDGSLHSDSRFVFTDLDVTEPADGPISRFLRLPAPLGTVVFVLRDENSVIDIPLDFDVEKDGVSLAEVSQVAIATLGRLIVDAIANSPFRVVGAVGDVAGMVGGLFGADALFGSGEEATPLDAVTLDFAPARDDFDTSALAALDALSEQIGDRGLEFRVAHELGLADRERAAVLANPAPGATLEIATRLRRLRDALLSERAALVETQRATLAARMDARVEPGAERLRKLDQDIGRTELALDSALERLRPNAERQAARRTAAACVTIARARLEAVRVALLERGDEELPGRLRVERARYREPLVEGGGRVTITITPRRLEQQPWYARLWGRIAGMVGLD
jgi:hypothetical protein